MSTDVRQAGAMVVERCHVEAHDRDGAAALVQELFGSQCTCTGVGEMSIRAGTARAVVLYMKLGMSVEEAVHEAVDDMRALKGGLIGRVTIHAIDAAGGRPAASSSSSTRRRGAVRRSPAAVNLASASSRVRDRAAPARPCPPS